jgi:hypothetical protein
MIYILKNRGDFMIIQFRTRAQVLDDEKQKPIDTAMKFGLADERTIEQSRVVDRLVYPVQREKLREVRI